METLNKEHVLNIEEKLSSDSVMDRNRYVLANEDSKLILKKKDVTFMRNGCLSFCKYSKVVTIVQFDKEVYSPDEKINFSVNVDNTDGSVPVLWVKGQIVQVLKTMSHNHKIVEEKYERIIDEVKENCQVVKPNEVKTIHMELKVSQGDEQGTCFLNCNGKFIKNEMHVVVKIGLDKNFGFCKIVKNPKIMQTIYIMRDQLEQFGLKKEEFSRQQLNDNRIKNKERQIKVSDAMEMQNLNYNYPVCPPDSQAIDSEVRLRR